MTQQDVRVKDYLSKRVVTVRPEQSVEEVEKEMLKYSKDGFPVVNEKEEIIGMISVLDILFRHPNMKIGKLMSRKVIAVSSEMKISDAARIMFRNGISRVPVIKDHKLVGIFTYTDALRAHIERVTPSKVMKLKQTFERVYNIPIKIKIGWVKINELIPTQIQINTMELEGRKYELKKGLAEPIIVMKSKGGNIIADGHHRAVAAHELDIKELKAYILIPNTPIEFGLEREARKHGLKSVEDIKIVEEEYPGVFYIISE